MDNASPANLGHIAMVAASLRTLALLTGFTLPRWSPDGDRPG